MSESILGRGSSSGLIAAVKDAKANGKLLRGRIWQTLPVHDLNADK